VTTLACRRPPGYTASRFNAVSRREDEMARKTITREEVKSNLSGEDVPEAEAWTVLLSPPDGRSSKKEIDLSSGEVAAFLKRLVLPPKEIKRRGRKPGSKNK
jgi:hypothetical protein